MEIRELVARAFQRDLSDPSALSDAFDSIRLLEPEKICLLVLTFSDLSHIL